MSTQVPRAQAARRTNGEGDDASETERAGDTRHPVRDWLDQQVSWLSSSLFHAIGLMVLALIPMLSHDQPIVAPVELGIEPIEPSPITCPILQVAQRNQDVEIELPTLPQITVHDDLVRQFLDWDDDLSNPVHPTPNPPGPPPGPPHPGPPGTKDVVRVRPGPDGIGNSATGPTEASETAVTAALAWLAAHQLRDGSWSFDHRDGVCNGRCKNHGQFKEAKNAATGLALLTFLGAGETHLEGRYQQVVDAGLRYLLSTQKIAGHTGSWHEAVGNSGNYSHAIATLAVCEALQMAETPPAAKKPAKSPSEMTEEERRRWKEERERAKRRPAEAVDKRRLFAASQAGINYLVDAQHTAGGWRYNKGQPGDTSIVGWVLMAMKGAYQAKVPVSKVSVINASRFLDSVQEGDYGSLYHYLPDKNRPEEAIRATTAIGLLCRMYLGWDRQHPGIGEGVAQLSRWRPSTGGTTNMYYNYYATQVMHHYGGQPWRDWNRVMRDYLVETQAKEGHETGSWRFGGDHGGTAGGRLYFTTLAAMTLEVYYRYLPIYKQRSVEDDLQGGGNDG